MENDGAHKFAFHLRELVRDLLRLVVPWVDELDFDEAEELSAAHVAASDGRFTQRYGDSVWRVPFRRGRLLDGSRPYLLVLIEFQATVDRTMARRMRDYAEMLRARLTLTTAAREGGLPWILPIVVYNGAERWTVPGERSELVALPSARARRALAWFQGRAYELVSLERMLAGAERGLADWPLDNRLIATFRLQTATTPAGLLRRLEREYAIFAGPGNAGTRRVLHAWTGALLADMAGGEAPLPAFEEMERLEGANMTTISQARLGKWFEDFQAKNVAAGVEQGLRQGVVQGVAQGRTLANGESAARLCRQAEVKFGDAVAKRLAELLGDKPAAVDLDRVGVWLMECTSGDELLARVEAHTDPS